MSAEEATERLARAIHDHFKVEGALHPSDIAAACDMRQILRSLPADDLAVLLAGRPVEERAQIAGLAKRTSVNGYVNDGGLLRAVPAWVAIPEEETS